MIRRRLNWCFFTQKPADYLIFFYFKMQMQIENVGKLKDMIM